jgi:hypothetical protein
METDGLGHRRILQSRAVAQAAADHFGEAPAPR